jgi:murein DD-endopeptidase MepM/ murein hydrolase activator NlpD
LTGIFDILYAFDPDEAGRLRSLDIAPPRARTDEAVRGIRLHPFQLQARARPLILLIVSVCLAAGLAYTLWPAPAGEAPDRSAVTATAPPAQRPVSAVRGRRVPPPLRFERVYLGQGGTLAATLDRLAIPPELSPRVLETAGRFIDLRRLPPQTGVVASFDDRDRPRGVSIRSEPERFLRIGFSDVEAEPSLRAELLELPVRVSVETTAGVVENSVAQALEAAPHGRLLTPAYADIFQWDVDLLVEPRPGDVVRVVYEVQRLGELPADLPRFGNTADGPGEFLRLGRILAASYEGEIASANAFWVDGRQDWGNYYDDEGRAVRKSFLKSPLNYRRISSGFSRARRHPVTRRVVPHHGVDFAAAAGTPVVATADGRVASAGWEGALGRAIRLRHGSEYVTVYGHLQRMAKGIRPGVEVRQNQVIGYVGSSGRATGPHLHYTVLRYGSPIDPMRMKNPPAKPLPEAMQPRLEMAMRRWYPLLRSISPVPPTLELASGQPPVASGSDGVRSGL